MTRWVLRILLMGAALWACGPREEIPGSDVPKDVPYGSWLMYGTGQKGATDAETMQNESSVLVLADSNYDTGLKQVTFTVTTATGMDWSAGEPRKLLSVQNLVPFQRDPGTVYKMEWVMQDSVMGLSAPDMESAWFIRWPR
jgi:hypothetical protein